jgi:UDP-4-amino-4,6-dideoxy-N-acetyl-beta-L-altrosamine transaminase
MKSIPYGRHLIEADDIEAVTSILKADFLTQGPQVELFEKTLAEYVGCKYSVAVTNGTAALHLATLALGVAPGQKVITTPNTFVASANCVRYCGGEVEFVDIDPVNYCLDLNALEEMLKSSPTGTYAGVIPVSFAGYPCDVERLQNLSKVYNFWIIEDACHALGAERLDSVGKWHKSGSSQYTDIGVFSFHPVKHIATGEGGMITTNNKDLYEKLKVLRTHGIVKDPVAAGRPDEGWYYEMQTLGFNYRISDILCALGTSQLVRMPENIKRRQEIATKYDRLLKGVVVPMSFEGTRHAYHLYVIQADRRKELYNYLKSHGVYCQVHYIPVTDQPYYKKRYGVSTPAKMKNYYERALSLPMFHSLNDADQDFVISKINSFYEK